MTVDIFLLESNIDFELLYTYRVPENISTEINGAIGGVRVSGGERGKGLLGVCGEDAAQCFRIAVQRVCRGSGRVR